MEIQSTYIHGPYFVITDFQITGPLQLQVYQVVAPYKSLGKGQINLQLDDQVDVIDKNANGRYQTALCYHLMCPHPYLIFIHSHFTNRK